MLFQQIENWRLRQHFKQVLSILHHADVSHLPDDLQYNRELQLHRLQEYAENGIFPRNYEKSPYSPCFIDRNNRQCAVAYLLCESGEYDLTNRVVALENYSHIDEMSYEELDNWAQQSGLSKAELQMIQPGYPFEFDSHLQVFTAITWLIGIVTLLLNLRHLRKEKREQLVPRITMFFALFVMFVGCGLLTLWQGNLSYENTIDVPESIIARALEDAPPFLHAGLPTLILGIIAVIIAFYTLGKGHPEAQKRKSKKSLRQIYRINKHSQKRKDI